MKGLLKTHLVVNGLRAFHESGHGIFVRLLHRLEFHLRVSLVTEVLQHSVESAVRDNKIHVRHRSELIFVVVVRCFQEFGVDGEEVPDHGASNAAFGDIQHIDASVGVHNVGKDYTPNAPANLIDSKLATVDIDPSNLHDSQEVRVEQHDVHEFRNGEEKGGGGGEAFAVA